MAVAGKIGGSLVFAEAVGKYSYDETDLQTEMKVFSVMKLIEIN